MSGQGRVPRPQKPDTTKRNLWIIGAAVLFLLCLLSLNIEPGAILDLPRGVATVLYEMYGKGGPDWAFFDNSMSAMIESLQMAWVGTIIGATLSLPLGFLGAKNVSSGLVSNVVRQILNAIRAFPEIILAIAIFIPIAGLGPVAGALAIGIHSAGTLGKLTAEAIEGIDPGPMEAARAAGGRGLQVQRWGVLPAGPAGARRLLAVPLRDQHPRRRRAGRGGCRRHRLPARPDHQVRPLRHKRAWPSSSSSWSPSSWTPSPAACGAASSRAADAKTVAEVDLMRPARPMWPHDKRTLRPA